MFRLKYLRIDTLQEHVIFLHEDAVHDGNLGFLPPCGPVVAYRMFFEGLQLRFPAA